MNYSTHEFRQIFTLGRLNFRLAVIERQTYFGDPLKLTFVEAPGALKVTDQAGAWLVYRFDPDDRITSLASSAGDAYSFTNDTRANLTRITFADGSAQHIDYDPRDRVVRVTGRAGTVVRHGSRSRMW